MDDGWKKRINDEIYGLYNKLLLSHVIKSWKQQWLEHLESSGRNRIVNDIGWRLLEEKRKRGKQKKSGRELFSLSC